MNNNLKKIFKHYVEFCHKHSSRYLLARLLNKLSTTSYVKTVGEPFTIKNVYFHCDGCGGQFDICQINNGKTLYIVYVNIDRLDVIEM